MASVKATILYNESENYTFKSYISQGPITKKVVIQKEKWSLWRPGYPQNNLNNFGDNLDAFPLIYQQCRQINIFF